MDKKWRLMYKKKTVFVLVSLDEILRVSATSLCFVGLFWYFMHNGYTICTNEMFISQKVRYSVYFSKIRGHNCKIFRAFGNRKFFKIIHDLDYKISNFGASVFQIFYTYQ